MLRGAKKKSKYRPLTALVYTAFSMGSWLFFFLTNVRLVSTLISRWVVYYYCHLALLNTCVDPIAEPVQAMF